MDDSISNCYFSKSSCS